MHRPKRADHRRIEYENVERLPTLRDCPGEPADAFSVGQVERGDRRAAATRVDALLDLLESRSRARGEDDVIARCRQRFGGRRPDPARCAGDER